MCEPTPSSCIEVCPPVIHIAGGGQLDCRVAELELAVDYLKKQNAELSILRANVAYLKQEIGLKVAFSASLGDNSCVQIGPACSEQTVVFKNVFFNMGDAYNACTGVFTAPCKGAFQFIFKTVGLCQFNSGAYLAKNGCRQVSTWRPKGNGRDTATQAVILELEAGDTVNLVSWAHGDQLWDNQYRYSTFSGFLLFRLDVFELTPLPCVLPLPECPSGGQSLEYRVSQLEIAVDSLKRETAELTILKKEVEYLKIQVGQKVAFSASLGDDACVQIGPACSEQTAVFKNVFFNNGNAYNACTGIFTAPCKGAYQFIFKTVGQCQFNSGAYLAKNGCRQVSIWRPKNGRDTATQAVILELEVGDTVKLVSWAHGDQLWDNQYRYSTFSGFLLFPLDEPKGCIDLSIVCGPCQ